MWTCLHACVIVLSAALLGLPGGHCSRRSDEVQRVLSDIYSMTKAERDTPPFPEHGPVMVDIAYLLNNVACLDKRHNTLDTAGYLRLRWQDPRLANPAIVDSSGVRVDPAMIWIPDIELFNAQAPGVQYLNRASLAMVTAYGDVTWIPEVATHSICTPPARGAANVTCVLKFGSWMYHTGQVNLQVTEPHVLLHYLMPSLDWEVQSTAATRTATTYSCCPESYATVQFSLTLNRRTSPGRRLRH